MLETIQQFPCQFAQGWSAGQKADFSRLTSLQVHRLYLAGMGGSSLAGDLINDYLGDRGFLNPIRTYDMPSRIGQDDLVICASYSGNTEETLEVFDKAFKKGIPIIVLAHGGALREKALKRKIPFIPIPECIQPRCALGYFFSSLLSLCERCELIENQEATLDALASFLQEQATRHESLGRELAVKLIGKVPVIYGPDELSGLCRIWKVKMNENAKVQSYYNVFPELNHNEMVGYTRLLMNPAIIYLKSQFMHPRVRDRMEMMESLLSKKMNFHFLELQGKNRLQEIFDAHALADFTSYYLAREYGIDPVPVEMVETFKKKIAL